MAEYNKVVEIQTDIINDELATHLFSTKFKVIDHTELIYEQAKDNSTMFDELIYLLRTKLAERNYLREQDSIKILPIVRGDIKKHKMEC